MIEINDHEFRLVVTEAYAQYIDALDKWERLEFLMGDQNLEEDRDLLKDAHENLRAARAKVMAVIGVLTDLLPIHPVEDQIPELLKASQERMKKGSG